MRLENLCSHALVDPKDTEKKVLKAYLRMAQFARFFCRKKQYLLRVGAQRYVHWPGGRIAESCARFDFLRKGFKRPSTPCYANPQSFVLAHYGQQEVLTLDVRAAVTHGFVTCQENCAPGVLSIALEHRAHGTPRIGDREVHRPCVGR
jgi:hypothetical protein